MNDSYRKLLHLEFRWKWIQRQTWFCELRDITVSLVSPSFIRRISLAASRFLSRLQSSFRDTNPLRSSFSTYCNKHTHVSFNSQWWTASPEEKRKNVSFLHERPWRYWRNTKSCHTDRSTAAWMPATDGNKHRLVWQQHCCILQREGFLPPRPPLLLRPRFLSQEMDRSVAQLLSSCGQESWQQRAPEPGSHYMTRLHLNEPTARRYFLGVWGLDVEGVPLFFYEYGAQPIICHLHMDSDFKY